LLLNKHNGDDAPKKKKRLRVFEDSVLRKILAPERDEVTGNWKRLQNDELQDLYCSLNIIWAIQ
jgi:hypothetical protein